MKSIFKFKVAFDEDIQERYVCARTTEEAFEKIEHYKEQLEQRGFATLQIISEPTVAIDYIIE